MPQPDAPPPNSPRQHGLTAALLALAALITAVTAFIGALTGVAHLLQ